MTKLITLTIDEHEVTVPEGTLVVDAAKKIGVDIPVFCYHPKMTPVGMCRMCLVDIGRPVVDRATGQLVREPDGSTRLQFGTKLETACTTPVSQGMVVRGMTDKVKTARKEVLEFLLTSHPLDCPICDKGGECPLQNLTLEHGPGQSRFLFDEKMHLAKQVPLGELIFLDRERCIQCGRCVRFQSEIAGEPVIGFYQRGRSLQIVTCSEPGFDSIFSGNTTDICPVGALTTADFRFGARPWEMKSAASICNHCSVGCNLAFNVRREARSDGRAVIKRVMPRQNEAVNEIWICDKGRLGYHFAESEARLTQPLVRKDGKLVPTAWDEALDFAAEGLRRAGANLTTLVGGKLSNEDLFNLRELTRAQNGKILLNSYMGGGDLPPQVGMALGSNFANLGLGSVILVAACDLHQEAPVWWLRVKQAADRGAALIVLNPRPTRLDQHAAHLLRYEYGRELEALEKLLPGKVSSDEVDVWAAGRALAGADNAVILVGSEGVGLEVSTTLAQLCAQILVETGHTGKPNSGLISVWPEANTQGAWDMGFRPSVDLAEQLQASEAAYLAGVDDPRLAQAARKAPFMLVQDLFLTETAQLADVVLPAQAYVEREGTFTSGERRVQRFYPAIPPRPGPRADFVIAAQLGQRLGVRLEARAGSLVMLRIAEAVSDYQELTYQKLDEPAEQWPIIGRHDLYFGGTGYDNQQGLGVQLAPAAQSGETPTLLRGPQPAPLSVPAGSLLAAPVTRLYDRGRLLLETALLDQRRAKQALILHPADAASLGLELGAQVKVTLDGEMFTAALELDDTLPLGAALAPRSCGLPVDKLSVVKIERV